ncbi:MAG: hypothetical protein WBD36_07845 [Bacteroidota bacterium]
MNQKSRIILLILSTSLVALGTLFAFGSSRQQKNYEMKNVGGKTNQCTCTQRLER